MHLIERDAPLQALLKAQETVAAGTGRLVLVSGEAGIGKTSLIDCFLQIQSTKWHVLRGACDDFFTLQPFAPLYDIASQITSELEQILQGETDRFAVFSTCLSLLQTPTILIIEDIHWADEATLDLLKYLSRRMFRMCSLLIVTFRDDALDIGHALQVFLGDVATNKAVRRLNLRPLSIEGVGKLAKTQTLDNKRLHQQTGGNPFFVTEVLATDEGHIPATIRDAVLARAARLSKNGRAVLNAIAVLGSRVEIWLLSVIVHTVASAADESVALGILVAQDDFLAFRHELTRQTILETMPPHQRIRLHQTVLDALTSASSTSHDIVRLAHHAAEANNADAILAYVPQVAVQARNAGMFQTSATLWALAIRHGDRLLPLEQAELYEKYALSLRTEADTRLPIKAYRQAVALAREADAPAWIEGRILARLTRMLLVQDDLDEADQVINQALAILEPLPPSYAHILAYKNRAAQLLRQGEPQNALKMAEKSVAIAEELQDIYTLLSAYETLGLCWLLINHSHGLAYLEKTLMLAREHEAYWRAGSVYPNLIMGYMDIYALDQAGALIAEGTQIMEDHDMDVPYVDIQLWHLLYNVYRGAWSSVDNQIQRLRDQASQLIGNQIRLLQAMARLQVRRGEATARQVLDDVVDLAQAVNRFQRWDSLYTVRAEAAWLAGNLAQTLAEANTAYTEALDIKHPSFAAELAYWRWRAGESVETSDWMLTPFVLEIHGDWRAAAFAWEALGCPYEQARALADGNTAAQLEALAIFERLGAHPMINIVRGKLRQANVKTIPRGPRASTQANPFNLTNRQFEIVTLLTENLTNAEIAVRLHISTKTVDHHVSAILAKLNVSSRKEAAKLAQQALK